MTGADSAWQKAARQAAPPIALNRRAIARDLSRVANAGVADVLATLGSQADGSASAVQRRRIGITGPPGAGKSTLIAALAEFRATRGRAVPLGVLAIDPTSPVSGGSILGDRIRMDRAAGLPDVYVRSLPSRSARNGLCDNVEDLFQVFDAHGFAEVMLETVGIGQSEVDIRALVDTAVLVLPPDAGDAVQAMKAGIIELADIFVVSRGAAPAARRMVAEIGAVLTETQARRGDGWTPPVLMSEIDRAGDIAALSDALDVHAAHLAGTGTADDRHALRRRQHLRALLVRRIDEVLESGAGRGSTLGARLDDLLTHLPVPRG